MLNFARQFGQRLWRTAKAFQNDQGTLLAAAVAYYAALSFFPLLLVLTAGLGFLLRFSGWGHDAQGRILAAVGEQGSPELERLVAEVLSQVETRATVSGPLGLATLLFTSMLIFAQLERAFNRVWRLPEPRERGVIATALNILLHRLKAFLMLLLVGGLLIAVFLTGMTIATLQAYTDALAVFNGLVWRLVHFAATVAINWALFTLLYKTLPRGFVPWTAAAKGGALAAVVWELGRLALAAILVTDRYNAYGVIGSFILVMLWMYYATATLLLGAEFGKTFLDSAPTSPEKRP